MSIRARPAVPNDGSCTGCGKPAAIHLTIGVQHSLIVRFCQGCKNQALDLESTSIPLCVEEAKRAGMKIPLGLFETNESLTSLGREINGFVTRLVESIFNSPNYKEISLWDIASIFNSAVGAEVSRAILKRRRILEP